MKKTTHLFTFAAVLLLIVFSVSCDKIRRDKGEIVSEPDMSLCFTPSLTTGTDEWVIRTQAEYDSLLATTSCTSAPETVDFNAYTLLGKYTSAKCKAKFYRQVLRDESAKTLHYNLLVKSRGMCKKMAFSYNWVLVPKVPADYTVEFTVKEK